MSPDQPGPVSGRGTETLAALGALQDHLAAVTAESRALRLDVHNAELARRRANRINSGVLVAFAVLVALLVGVGWQVQSTNRTLADCTTPGRDCYEQGRARQASAVAAVVRISVYVSQCGRLWPGESGPDYDAKLEKCVAERLAAATAGPTPSPSTGG